MSKSKSMDERKLDQQDALDAQRQAQKNGEIGTTPGNKDNSVEIPDNEAAGYVHVMVSEKYHNAVAKSYEKTSKRIAIHMNQFDQLVKSGAFNLYDEARIVHDPRKGKVTKYDSLKTETVPATATAGSEGRQAKSADMSAINEAKSKLKAQAEKLDDLDEALAAKGEKLEELDETLSAKEKALNDREAQLAEREKALNAAGSSTDAK